MGRPYCRLRIRFDSYSYDFWSEETYSRENAETVAAKISDEAGPNVVVEIHESNIVERYAGSLK
jgi:hypothetical protein